MRVFPPEHLRARPFASLVCFLLLSSVHLAPTLGARPSQDEPYIRWENGVSEAWGFNTERHARAEIEAMQARWKLLGDEIAASAGERWAGDYFIGSETHGSYLRWSPRGGFVLLKVNKCAAEVENFSYGTVDATPTLIKLTTERAMLPEGHHEHSHAPAAERLLPVTLRGARLLVEADAMREFGDYVAGLGRVHHPQFLHYDVSYAFFHKLDDGDLDAAAPASEARSRDADIIVPPGYEHFLKQPLEGEITAVGRRVVRRDYEYKNADGTGTSYNGLASITPVTVSVGSTHGAKPEMILRSRETGEEVRLTRAGKFSSSGVLVRSLDERGKETFYDHDAEGMRVYPRVAVGWKLTTSPF